MKLKKPNITFSKCYLCTQNTVVPSFNKLGYTVLKCKNCGLLSLDFNQEYSQFLKSYYQEGYFTGNKKLRAYANYADDKENIAKNAQKLLNKADKYTKDGNLLDVGCAMGFFMEEAQKKGYKSYGIEVSDYAATIARKKFPKTIYKGSVEDFLKNRTKIPQFKGMNFDLITLSDLIEHVNDPREVLNGLKSMLKPKGIISIQTGDAGSFWATLMGKNWHFYAPPQHLYFFSQKTLTTLLKQAGYELIKLEKVGKYVSLRYIFHMTQYMNIPVVGDYLNTIISSNTVGKISFPVKLFDNMIVFARLHLPDARASGRQARKSS
ncbi:class I SAM-dependent methyltransferase [Candidatus Gottesmanbacteria bacterium]|nr:class I SAM-dependent methyltransferase [Candidatus Gottesmanbacteria bacterium]